MAVEREQEFINFTLQNWGDLAIDKLQQQIAQKKLVLSGDLQRSLEFEVLKASSGQIAKLLLAFEDAGRFKDMKGLNRTKMTPVKVMEEYVRKVGWNKFKYVPGFQSKKRIPTESQAINAIAWGLSRNSLTKKHKPKRWFAKPFYGTINNLITQLLEGYQEFSADAITQNLQ